MQATLDTLTTEEAARLLGVLPSTLRHAVRRGALLAEKRGRDLFLTRAEVERYGREHKPSGKPKKEEARHDC